MTGSSFPSSRATLFVTATSHLDTQWRWTYQDTIHHFLPETLRANFAHFEKYPEYRFAFEGAFRYMLVEEYHPALFAELTRWIAEGRWCLTGSSVDAGDVITVSPESLVRQILLGNGYFREKFGRESHDIFLPDCFGFGWALPSIAAHCGLKGFSTSKLEWGSSVGIPFNLGFWEGVDGNGVFAAINPGQYSLGFCDNLATDETWTARIARAGAESGTHADLKYFGLGDTGGAPDEASVRALCESIHTADGLHVVSAAPDDLFLALNDTDRESLPRHRGEFLLIEHGAGTFTSHGQMKRWNRANEQLAYAAEAAATMADWLGAMPYPHCLLREAWIRVLANQMHDILPGTCIPEAYRFAWNDEAVALNHFSLVLSRAVAGMAGQMERPVGEHSLVLFNSLARERSALVRAKLPSDGANPLQVGGKPVQVLGRSGPRMEVLFPAEMPSMGIQSVALEQGAGGGVPLLRNTGRILESDRLLAELDENGDLARLYDKEAGREVLHAPARLELLDHAPEEWPAWTITHGELSRPPREFVTGPAEFEAIETGPWRAAIKVTRHLGPSIYTLVYRLEAAPWGRQLEVEAHIEWATPASILKATFPFAAENEHAVYDLGLGTVERETNQPRLHEVPAQQWAALTDEKTGQGAAILSDCKYGWDKPDGRTLRLTLLHTPGDGGFTCHLGGAEFTDDFAEQFQLDYGRHRMRWAIRPVGSRAELQDVVRAAEEMHQPVYTFRAIPGGGALGPRFSFMEELPADAALMALKKSEDGTRLIARVRSLRADQSISVEPQIGTGHSSTELLRGDEQPFDVAKDERAALPAVIPPSSLQTIAIVPRPPAIGLEGTLSSPLELPWNHRGISTNDNRMDGDFDGTGRSIPSEQLPAELDVCGIRFRTGPRGYREKNIVVCDGQRLALPEGKWNGIALLLANVSEGTIEATAWADGKKHALAVPSWSRPAGQWDSRVHLGRYTDRGHGDLRAGYLEQAPLGWAANHRHSRAANADEAYEPCHLYLRVLPIRGGAAELQLPTDWRVRIVAASMVHDPGSGIEPGGDLPPY